ncbi:hypothetical protein HYT01_03630 [Candidatus Giovannonibacteria bacterium]|nr:hypothetical protein [Candidatus Giovannonibacteria bacterium]
MESKNSLLKDVVIILVGLALLLAINYSMKIFIAETENSGVPLPPPAGGPPPPPRLDGSSLPPPEEMLRQQNIR